jgi:hypothetical protein
VDQYHNLGNISLSNHMGGTPHCFSYISHVSRVCLVCCMLTLSMMSFLVKLPFASPCFPLSLTVIVIHLFFSPPLCPLPFFYGSVPSYYPSSVTGLCQVLHFVYITLPCSFCFSCFIFLRI